VMENLAVYRVRLDNAPAMPEPDPDRQPTHEANSAPNATDQLSILK
jgi:hypothetical protein